MGKIRHVLHQSSSSAGVAHGAYCCGLCSLFLSARAGQNASPNTIPLRLVVVNSAGEAEKILEQLKNGADFRVLAREKSVDATSIDGGFLGNVDPTSLRAELRDALHGLEPGRISRVLNSRRASPF